jgi:hypothetical protein
MWYDAPLQVVHPYKASVMAFSRQTSAHRLHPLSSVDALFRDNDNFSLVKQQKYVKKCVLRVMKCAD